MSLLLLLVLLIAVIAVLFRSHKDDMFKEYPKYKKYINDDGALEFNIDYKEHKLQLCVMNERPFKLIVAEKTNYGWQSVKDLINAMPNSTVGGVYSLLIYIPEFDAYKLDQDMYRILEHILKDKTTYENWSGNELLEAFNILIQMNKTQQ